MTLPATLGAAGVQIPTLLELADDLAASQKATVDPLLLTEADSLLGNLNAAFCSHLREVYELGQSAFDTIDPNNAEDARLDIVSSITGTLREGATHSLLTGTRKATVNLGAGVTLPAGSRAYVLDTPTAIFETTEDVTNPSGGAADVPVSMQSVDTGPIHANAGTLTIISTPIVGWNSVTNAFDATLGAVVQSDTALRLKRQDELAQAGTSTLPSLKANLSALVDSGDGVTQPIISVEVYENDTMVAANGIPPKAFEAVIWDGPSPAAANADVAAVVFDAKGLGIATSGGVSVTVLDSDGVAHVVKFSRATQRTVEFSITLIYDAQKYVGDAAVKTAIADAFQGSGAQAQGVGGKVSFSVYMAIVQALGGVKRIEGWQMKFSGGSFSSFTDLSPGMREVAVTDTSVITVTSTAG